MAKMCYRPLNTALEEIRLLTVIHYAAIDVSDGIGLSKVADIQFTIEHYPLQDWRSHETHNELCPAMGCFVALSYTWGEPGDLDQIVVDDHVVCVQSNLKKALLALSCTNFIRSGCKIWADAICINQHDEIERNREVKRMRLIYQKCWNVVFWLGDANRDSDEAIDFINGTSNVASQGPLAIQGYFGDFFATSQAINIWENLSELIHRPYFLRLWIIQEIAMGRRESPVLCGSKMRTWSQMYIVYQVLREDPTPSTMVDNINNPILATGFHKEMKAHSEVLRAYKSTAFWKWGKCEDFCILQDKVFHEERLSHTFQVALLTRCGLAQCGDPRDKVFGILGLVDGQLAEATTVDYKREIAAVYAEFSQAWMEAYGSLELLENCGASGEHYIYNELLPSWVVDLGQEVRPQAGKNHPGFHAHGDKKATFSINGTILTARGVLLDRIDGVSGVRHWEDDFADHPDVTSSTFCANQYGDTIGFQDVLWHVLNDNRYTPVNDVEETHPSILDSIKKIILDSAILDPHCSPPVPVPHEQGTDDSFCWSWHLWVKRNAEFMLGSKQFKDWLDNNNAMRDDSGSYFAALARVDYTLWSRRLVTTNKGYIGKAPRPTQRGDFVAVLWGCSVPLVLRESAIENRDRKQYRIIGECYIQGIMDGELVKEIEKGTYTEEEIEVF